MITSWNGKPHHSLDYMLKERFGEKVYKVTLNGGMSCPNRDGKSILDGIVKFRKNRVDVQEDHQVNDQDHHK